MATPTITMEQVKEALEASLLSFRAIAAIVDAQTDTNADFEQRIDALEKTVKGQEGWYRRAASSCRRSHSTNPPSVQSSRLTITSDGTNMTRSPCLRRTP